jgi:uncharacterized protein (DUF1810 family)
VNDEYDLQRFMDAQDSIYDEVLSELRAGRKSSHWMWFIFPQVAGLGYSQRSRRYAIGSRAEATTYAGHPVLGIRLSQCTALVNNVEGRTLLQIFGSPDDMKFRSSMTLFSICASHPAIFQDALDKYCHGEGDPMTVSRLE